VSFSRAELAGWVTEFYALVGDIPGEIVLLDYLAGAYDPLTLEGTRGAAVSLPVQALVTRYRSGELAPDTVLSTDRKVAIRQVELPGVIPATRDRLTMDGHTWYVIDVHQDTGGSLWVLQARRDSEAEEE
jgi:hypothetical protein